MKGNMDIKRIITFFTAYTVPKNNAKNEDNFTHYGMPLSAPQNPHQD
jgi:hypothetical protein